MTEVRDRLEELRSFIWWTAPLYAVFVGAGLCQTHFTFTLALAALLLVLTAFGVLDGLILVNLRALRAQIAATPEGLHTAQERLKRLSRTVLLGGAALGAAGLSAVVMLAL